MAEAKVRSDALKFADPQKSLLSMITRGNTPPVCLACEHCAVDLTCEVSENQRAVLNRWNWESSPQTPLTEICPRFLSNRRP